MWWLFLPQIVFISQGVVSLWPGARFEVMMQQFLLLGIIPGTTVQLSFSSVCLLLVCLSLGLLTLRLYSLAMRTIHTTIDPDYDLPPGIRRIDLITL